MPSFNASVIDGKLQIPCYRVFTVYSHCLDCIFFLLISKNNGAFCQLEFNKTTVITCVHHFCLHICKLSLSFFHIEIYLSFYKVHWWQAHCLYAHNLFTGMCFIFGFHLEHLRWMMHIAAVDSVCRKLFCTLSCVWMCVEHTGKILWANSIIMTWFQLSWFDSIWLHLNLPFGHLSLFEFIALPSNSFHCKLTTFRIKFVPV